MSAIAIGVSVHAEPERLTRTLGAIARNTVAGYELVIVPDGADDATREAIGALAGPRVLADRGARGGAAALNRLFTETGAEIVVLLESGAVPAPGWLDRLLGALDDHPRAGLAGPSTNRSWNEQVQHTASSDSDADLARAAEQLQRRHGSTAVVLAPLYSLGDFCYAVRREVFDSIGPADEEYGLGPCWEMDYNVRAARAGFDGLWVRAAFVWRSPFTARRAADEANGFNASRRRYQDKFCGALQRGTRTEYRDHCRGDACVNFAPRPEPADAAAAIPLVSCIMPTFDRRPFLPLALECFRQQTYPRRELIVVDDGTDSVEDLVRGEPDVRYIRLKRRLTIGAKRNLACREARGEIIAHWDDDDWYGPTRLAVQVEPILSGDADITGMQNRFVLVLPEQKFWTIDPRVHRSMFVGDLHGGTIVFRASILRSGLRYPDSNLGEDAYLLRQAARRGMRMRRIDNDGSFVYLRHGTNTWRFATGSFIDPKGWHETAAPAAFTGEHLAAYRIAVAGISR
ncbi:MAG TPA: glycosyltransferase [Thermoanaerobaculia bacterium]|nr:glycosyltransferase [Thermoanaerobaculia bacterium]